MSIQGTQSTDRYALTTVALDLERTSRPGKTFVVMYSTPVFFQTEQGWGVVESKPSQMLRDTWGTSIFRDSLYMKRKETIKKESYKNCTISQMFIFYKLELFTENRQCNIF